MILENFYKDTLNLYCTELKQEYIENVTDEMFLLENTLQTQAYFLTINPCNIVPYINAQDLKNL